MKRSITPIATVNEEMLPIKPETMGFLKYTADKVKKKTPIMSMLTANPPIPIKPIIMCKLLLRSIK